MARHTLDLRAAAARIHARARAEQGLPFVPEDPVVLDEVAALLDPGPTIPARAS